MAKIPLYNSDGKETGVLEAHDAVFAAPVSVGLVHQVYTAMRANARLPWAHTKDRGDVSGGGKKPWRQKGTGRARHGSIRSPIWKGGGVTFGPLSTRNYKQKINKKMSQAALRMGLSARLSEARLVALEAFPQDGKTKAIAALRAAIVSQKKSTLLVTAEKDVPVKRAARNLPQVDVVRALDVSIADLLDHQYVLVSKNAVLSLEKRLMKGSAGEPKD